ncbi:MULTISPECIES: hypothetical protein [unclassified Streptomyces]|uniref:hypothetical protein n=1 Tax=unclassified Streptomyces TaxID=2593676 RepID=UPI0036E96AF4
MQTTSYTFLSGHPKNHEATPIFDRLVFERGDVPAQVRRDAQRLERDLARAMNFAGGDTAIPLQQAHGLPPIHPTP